MPQLGASGAPPALPILALLFGALSFVAVGIILVVAPGTLLEPLNAPGIVALVHLVTIGVVSTTFAGTLQQLPPVMMVTHLKWRNLGVIAVPLLLAGALTLVIGFALNFAPLMLIVGGSAVVIAWLLLVAQLLATALTKWPTDAASQALITAMVFLLFTVIVGFILVHIKVEPQAVVHFGYPRALHYTIGMFGAFLLGIVGAGQKLLAMFALSKGTKDWRVRTATRVIAIGVILAGLSAFTSLQFGVVPMAFLMLGALLHVWEVWAILRVRLRKVLEAPIFRFVLAHAFLLLAGALLLAGQGIAATVAFLLGFVGIVISGMAVKIVSFLIWTAVFTGKQGGLSGRAPLLRDLVIHWLEHVITWPLTIGVLGLVTGVITRQQPIIFTAGVLVTIGAFAFFWQLAHVVRTTVRAGQALDRELQAQGEA